VSFRESTVAADRGTFRDLTRKITLRKDLRVAEQSTVATDINIIWRMRSASRITKVIDTRAECLVPIAFPLRRCCYKRLYMRPQTHTDCTEDCDVEWILFCQHDILFEHFNIIIIFFFCCGAATQCGSLPPHFLRFLDHTQWGTTVLKTSGRVIISSHRPVHDNTQHSQQTPMPLVGFELTITAAEPPQTYTLDRADTGTGWLMLIILLNSTAAI
jgi:hypothetical protein